MALPLVPILIFSGLTGATGLGAGFITGGALSDKLGVAFTVGGIALSLFLMFILARQFNLTG